MVKGDAMKFRKGIKGKMDKKQEAHYKTLLTREGKGYAEAKAKLEARKARGDFKPKPTKKDKHRRGEDQEPTTHYGKETKRPTHKVEKRSAPLIPNYEDYTASTPTPEGFDPTKINVKKDKKVFANFRPEHMTRIADSGLRDTERSQDHTDTGYMGHNLVQYPTTTTGGEAIFQDRGGRLEHPSMLGGLLNEETIIGQTLDRGDYPETKPISWEGTKAGGYSRKQGSSKTTPMTLERRMKKGAMGSIGKTDEELRKSQAHPRQKPHTEPKAREYPNVPIFKSAEYMSGNMGYKKNRFHTQLADLRIKQGAFSRGECGGASNTCSEFYILEAHERTSDITRQSPMFRREHKGIAKPSQLDYKMDRIGETLAGQKKSATNIELDIVRQYGGKGGRTLGTNELAVNEGMSYSFDKGRPRHRKERQEGIIPVDKMKVKDLRRLAQNRGVPTTIREEASREYEPTKFKAPELRAKLKGGLPVDMAYNYYGQAGVGGDSSKGVEDVEEKAERLRTKGFSKSGTLLAVKEILHKSDTFDGDVSDGDEDFDEENPMGNMDAYRY